MYLGKIHINCHTDTEYLYLSTVHFLADKSVVSKEASTSLDLHEAG